jgi:hypothetical protein
MKDPRASSGSCGNGSAPPDADPRHYAIAIVKKASCRARSDLGDLHPQEGRHTLRRHQGKGDPGLVVIKEWWSLDDQICEVADRFARQARPHPD